MNATRERTLTDGRPRCSAADWVQHSRRLSHRRNDASERRVSRGDQSSGASRPSRLGEQEVGRLDDARFVVANRSAPAIESTCSQGLANAAQYPRVLQTPPPTFLRRWRGHGRTTWTHPISLESGRSRRQRLCHRLRGVAASAAASEHVSRRAGDGRRTGHQPRCRRSTIG